MTSREVVRRTLATLRRAEFGFFGVVVYTREHTPRFCGFCSIAGTLFRFGLVVRGLRINGLMCGIQALSIGKIHRRDKSKPNGRHSAPIGAAAPSHAADRFPLGEAFM